MKKRKKILILPILLILAISLLFVARLSSPSEIDDVHPLISCPEMEEYNPKVLYIIPKYQGKPISEYPEWCEEILSLNKTLALHGYKHNYKEYEKEIMKEQLEESIKIFEDCFGFKPSLFKPPYLAISKENKKLVEEQNITTKRYFNQFTKKVYHCNDHGIFPNWFIRIY